MDGKKYLVNTSETVSGGGLSNAGQSTFVSYLPSVLLTVLLFAVSALSSLFQFDFYLQKIIWHSFIMSTALRLVVVFCAKWVGADTAYQRGKQGNDVMRAREAYLKEGEGVSFHAFEKWIEAYNLLRKKELYLLHLRAKAEKLEAKGAKLLREASISGSSRKERRGQALIRRAHELLSCTTDDYLEEHLPYMRVRGFYPISAATFFAPSVTGIKRERYSLDEAKENTVEIAKGMPLMLLLTTVTCLVGYSASIGTVTALSVMMDLVNILVSFITGWRMVGEKNLRKLISVYISRKTVLEAYKKEL